ncbi:MAG: TIGR04282 family arsenosugar biosynthesis glycosyltransferase [bacterium]
MESRDTTLCIFVKAPRAGAVKTRLAASIGVEAAARLADAFFWDTLALAEQFATLRVVVALAGEERLLPMLRDRVAIWPQGDGDLGARLERNFRRALTETPRALAIGTDSPGLPATLVAQARAALDTHDAVLGPADDGGFYLLGMRTCPEGLLVGLPWSAGNTLEKTLTRLEERGLTVKLLPPWFDVDLEGDLERLRALLSAEEIHAPATSRVLGIHPGVVGS